MSHFNLDGDLTDIAASILGAIVVLVAGSIWRSRKMRNAEHAPAAVEAASPAD
jgi:hypothetical protein